MAWLYILLHFERPTPLRKRAGVFDLTSVSSPDTQTFSPLLRTFVGVLCNCTEKNQVESPKTTKETQAVDWSRSVVINPSHSPPDGRQMQ
jgi:hypothetical protein